MESQSPPPSIKRIQAEITTTFYFYYFLFLFFSLGVCVCQRKTKDRADGMREKSAHCPRRDSNLYLWDTRRAPARARVCVCVCVCPSQTTNERSARASATENNKSDERDG